MFDLDEGKRAIRLISVVFALLAGFSAVSTAIAPAIF
jgi:hypothetical protein